MSSLESPWIRPISLVTEQIPPSFATHTSGKCPSTRGALIDGDAVPGIPSTQLADSPQAKKRKEKKPRLLTSESRELFPDFETLYLGFRLDGKARRKNAADAKCFVDDSAILIWTSQ
ncbi:hypothetical protein MLD38_040151 [Melastoma candidum]|uniref:Uncharacterized protein n=1 Tax=Melastoma candidum TaxID=119954 RepID=A0ACB9L4B9_9MYRT|nr:hypothetical protein MLD38_040151 [Melastoma candidum]